MVLRDPLAAQRLFDRGEEAATITELLGPQAKPYQPPGPGMGFSTGKPFRFNDPVPGQAPGAPVAPAMQSARPAVTTIIPSRQAPFSRADAQALAALDPRALDEAKSLAAMPESTPRMITGKNETTGESFQMQPSARVDRNALARLYAKAQERQAQERQDSVRAQEQGGRERLVGIPGQQLNERDKYRVDSDERVIGKKLEADAPMRAADIAAKGAQTAAVSGAEARAQANAARQPNQEKAALLEKILEAKRSSPFAATMQGRNDIAAAEKLLASTSGVDLPATPQGVDPSSQFDNYAALLNDPNVAKMVEQLKGSKQGVFYSKDRATKGSAAGKALRSYVQRYADAKGIDAEEAMTQIMSMAQ